jgi:hypothetical protein
MSVRPSRCPWPGDPLDGKALFTSQCWEMPSAELSRGGAMYPKKVVRVSVSTPAVDCGAHPCNRQTPRSIVRVISASLRSTQVISRNRYTCYHANLAADSYDVLGIAAHARQVPTGLPRGLGGAVPVSELGQGRAGDDLRKPTTAKETPRSGTHLQIPG